MNLFCFCFGNNGKNNQGLNDHRRTDQWRGWCGLIWCFSSKFIFKNWVQSAKNHSSFVLIGTGHTDTIAMWLARSWWLEGCSHSIWMKVSHTQMCGDINLNRKSWIESDEWRKTIQFNFRYRKNYYSFSYLESCISALNYKIELNVFHSEWFFFFFFHRIPFYCSCIPFPAYERRQSMVSIENGNWYVNELWKTSRIKELGSLESIIKSYHGFFIA